MHLLRHDASHGRRVCRRYTDVARKLQLEECIDGVQLERMEGAAPFESQPLVRGLEGVCIGVHLLTRIMFRLSNWLPNLLERVAG